MDSGRRHKTPESETRALLQHSRQWKLRNCFGSPCPHPLVTERVTQSSQVMQWVCITAAETQGFPGGADLPAVQEIWVRSLGQEDPLEKEMATHSRILAYRILWTEGTSGLPSMGLHRVGYDWSDLAAEAANTLAWRISWTEEPGWAPVHGVSESDTTKQLTLRKFKLRKPKSFVMSY